MSTHTWHLFVDESGNFRDPGQDVTVAGLLVSDDQLVAAEAVRHSLANLLPYLPWPLHAAHMNLPVWTALTWQQATDRALSGLRLRDGPLQALERLVGDDERSANGLTALREGRHGPTASLARLANLAELALREGRGSTDLRDAYVALNSVAAQRPHRPTARGGLHLIEVAERSAGMAHKLATREPDRLEAVRGALGDGVLPKLRDVLALQAHAFGTNWQALRDEQVRALTVVRRVTRKLRARLPAGALTVVGASESCLGDARTAPLDRPGIEGSPYLALLYVAVERAVDALALREGEHSLELWIQNRPVDRRDRRPRHLRKREVDDLLAPLSARRPGQVRLRLQRLDSYGRHSPAAYFLADLVANRLRYGLAGSLDQVEQHLRKETALELRAGPRGHSPSQLAAHGLARDYVETGRVGLESRTELADPELRCWAREQALEWT